MGSVSEQETQRPVTKRGSEESGAVDRDKTQLELASVDGPVGRGAGAAGAGPRRCRQDFPSVQAIFSRTKVAPGAVGGGYGPGRHDHRTRKGGSVPNPACQTPGEEQPGVYVRPEPSPWKWAEGGSWSPPSLRQGGGVYPATPAERGDGRRGGSLGARLRDRREGRCCRRIRGTRAEQVGPRVRLSREKRGGCGKECPGSGNGTRHCRGGGRGSRDTSSP